MTSRFMLSCSGSFSPSRSTVSFTLLPAAPRILSTASESDRPITGTSSIALMKSLGLMPAFAAGVSSIGDTTFTSPFSIVTSMPRPPNSPFVCTFMSPNCFSFM